MYISSSIRLILILTCIQCGTHRNSRVVYIRNYLGRGIMVCRQFPRGKPGSRSSQESRTCPKCVAASIHRVTSWEPGNSAYDSPQGSRGCPTKHQVLAALRPTIGNTVGLTTRFSGRDPISIVDFGFEQNSDRVEGSKKREKAIICVRLKFYAMWEMGLMTRQYRPSI